MKFLAPLLGLIFLISCSNKGYVAQESAPDILLKEGQQYIAQGDFHEAINVFSKLEMKYSFSDKALQAKLMLIWLNYQSGENIRSDDLIQEYRRYYPYSRYDYYLNYLQALVAIAQIKPHGRDAGQGAKALKYIDDYIRMYPNTKEARDLKFKRPLVLNVLAKRDLDIALYYSKHKVFGAAINRLLDIITNYSTTIFVPEALYRLVWAHAAIGLRGEASNYYQILKSNYPRSKWCKYASELL